MRILPSSDPAFALPFVTIDGSHSVDLDDAIHVERMRDGHVVTVAVADVAAAVLPDTPEDRAAREQVATIYAGEATVRFMLPRELTLSRLTLATGRPNPAFVLRLALGPDGEVLDCALGRGEVGIARRLDHESAIAAARDAGAVAASLKTGYALARELILRRAKHGAMAAANPDKGLLTDEEGRLQSVKGSALSHLLVQEMMILANATLAHAMAGEGQPLLFRNHRARLTANKDVLLEDLRRAVSGQQADLDRTGERQAHLVERATLGATADGHFGLNLLAYAWFTSPIRRYADLVNQRIVAARIAGGSSPYAPDQLSAIAAHGNEVAARRAEATSRHFQRQATREALESARNGLETLEAHQFSRVVKAAAVEGQSIDLADEIRRRAAQGPMSAKDMFRLLFAPSVAPAARRAMAEILAAAPWHAPSILAHAANTEGWSHRTIEEGTATGKPHQPTFRSTVEIVPAGDAVRASATSPAKRTATQVAYAKAMLAIAGVGWPDVGSSAPAPGASDGGQAAPAAQPDGTARSNPKSKLMEWAQKAHTGAPRFEHHRSGPPHAPVFEAIVTLKTRNGPLSARAAGASKREAEANASAALIRDHGDAIGIGI